MEFVQYIKYDDHIIYRIRNDKKYLSWNDFYNLIQTDNSKYIYMAICDILRTNLFISYYLEFSPTTYNLMSDIIFEFVLVKTSDFVNKTDIYSFGESNLNTNSNLIYSFYNLSKTSILISPCYNHNYNINIYNNIGTFMRSTNLEQKLLLLTTSFINYFNELLKNPDKKLWLSTHGKGIGWLHMRIDNTAKYISWKSYKNI